MRKDYDLERFLRAQDGVYSGYKTALEEMKHGRKVSHWIWYIFPQIAGLGRSSTAIFYSIADEGEAKAYMEHAMLRERLLEISSVLLDIPSDDARLVMGAPDDMKLRSSMTLFAEVTPEYEVFQMILDKFFDGRKDGRTLAILNGRKVKRRE